MSAQEQYYVDNDKDLLGKMDDYYQQNSSQWLQYFYEGDIDTRLAAGDQEAMYSYIGAAYNQKSRNLASFNKIRPIVNLITGSQTKNRKTSIVTPQEPEDQETADQLSGVLQWIMINSNGYGQISKAFHGAIVAGINLLQPWLDYSDDPVNGDIRISHIPFNSFLVDPYFKELDFSDCNYLWTRKWLSKG